MSRSKPKPGRSPLPIVMIEVGQLTPDPQNVKLHTSQQIEQIASSIRRFGFRDPVGVWGGNNLIVEGHGRRLAALSLGLQSVPCIRLDHLSNSQRRAYAIAANQTTFNTPLDTNMLVAEFDRLAPDHVEHDAMGFTPDDLLFLIPENRDFSAMHGSKFGADSSSFEAHLDEVFKTTIVFDNEAQQSSFYEALGNLRRRYFDAQTAAERLSKLMEESGRG